MWIFYTDMPTQVNDSSDLAIITTCLSISVIAWILFLSLAAKVKNESR